MTNNLTVGENWSSNELNHRLAQLAGDRTPLEKRRLLRKWMNESFKRGMQYSKKQYGTIRG